MLAVERHRRILDMLLKAEAVSTVTVARELGITAETVRRDFEELEADGRLSRRHGGAVCADDSRRDLSLNSRENANVAEKRAIAQLALPLIQPGDTVLFDASSTVFHLAAALSNIELTVVTNALKAAIELSRRPAIQVIVVGGAVNPRSLSCQGSLADLALESFHIQKAFLSCRGVDAARGASEANGEQAGLKRKIIELADQAVLLADHTKTGSKSSFIFGALSDFDALITDRPPPSAVKNALRKGGGKLITHGA
ncbi:MAG TPA: DeoR/GlpR family DNA-binding transcription regulator [Verrucomicrobiae bacterium]|jgi:DeoR/GlpR family transcriptional regulator of sugar metabolism|nr:DeoR/GlpR family DNA-binding transcription regulator [Verrucomicrobiae bacterium]